jgi:hypothetical protein
MKLFSFWSGGELSFIERLCLASMLEFGHDVDVYSYDPSLKLPPGVTLMPAEDILPDPPASLIHARKWALISNIFRYAGLKRSAGI